MKKKQNYWKKQKQKKSLKNKEHKNVEQIATSNKVAVAFTIILRVWRRQSVQWKDAICTYNNSRYVQN
jgi:hypothetical protein